MRTWAAGGEIPCRFWNRRMFHAASRRRAPLCRRCGRHSQPRPLCDCAERLERTAHSALRKAETRAFRAKSAFGGWGACFALRFISQTATFRFLTADATAMRMCWMTGSRPRRFPCIRRFAQSAGMRRFRWICPLSIRMRRKFRRSRIPTICSLGFG